MANNHWQRKPRTYRDAPFKRQKSENMISFHSMANIPAKVLFCLQPEYFSHWEGGNGEGSLVKEHCTCTRWVNPFSCVSLSLVYCSVISLISFRCVSIRLLFFSTSSSSDRCKKPHLLSSCWTLSVSDVFSLVMSSNSFWSFFRLSSFSFLQRFRLSSLFFSSSTSV